MATLASAGKKQKTDHGKKMNVNTFLKWNVQNIFDYETETVEGTSYVIKIKCTMCVKHIDSIERDDRLKGVARQGMRTYVDGSNFITKHNVNRHINGKLSSIIPVELLEVLFLYSPRAL